MCYKCVEYKTQHPPPCVTYSSTSNVPPPSTQKSGNQLSTNCRICTSRKNRERARVRERTVASIIPPTKVCRSCKLEKPSDRYYRNMGAYDGLFARCKDCSMLQRVAKYVEEPTVTHKVCRKCHIDKPASEFARNRSIRDGLYRSGGCWW